MGAAAVDVTERMGLSRMTDNVTDAKAGTAGGSLFERRLARHEQELVQLRSRRSVSAPAANEEAPAAEVRPGIPD